MKKLLVTLCVLTLIFGVVNTSQAILMKYVFEKEYNEGFKRSDSTIWGDITVGSQDNFLNFWAAADVSDWVAWITTVRVPKKFTISKTASTTNITAYRDVLLKEIRGGAPVPEPETLLLLGTGLIGLAGFGRKKFFKK